MSKPTSKVIQISTTSASTAGSSLLIHHSHVLTALCEDGSIWECKCADKKWEQILEPHKPSQPIVPMPGSRWRKKSSAAKVLVNCIFFEDERLFIAYDETEEELLEDFLKLYEPAQEATNGGSND